MNTKNCCRTAVATIHVFRLDCSQIENITRKLKILLFRIFADGPWRPKSEQNFQINMIGIIKIWHLKNKFIPNAHNNICEILYSAYKSNAKIGNDHVCDL